MGLKKIGDKGPSTWVSWMYETQGSERLSNLLRITQLRSGKSMTLAPTGTISTLPLHLKMWATKYLNVMSLLLSPLLAYHAFNHLVSGIDKINTG